MINTSRCNWADSLDFAYRRTSRASIYHTQRLYSISGSSREILARVRFFSIGIPFPCSKLIIVYTLAKELYPGKYRPTLTHSFIKLLSDKGLLGLCLTQNIDTLERRAGIPANKIVEAHGSFATQRCIECKHPFSDTEMKDFVKEERIPRCTRKPCKGLIKPDIVFFGESVSVYLPNALCPISFILPICQLPTSFFKALGQLHDADLLIVIGTSLTVHPFAALVNMVGGQCPRVLINLDKVGGIGSGKKDMVFLGKCDDIIRDLARELGWEDELDKEWAATAASLDTDETTEEKDQADESELAAEIEKIVERVEGALSISEKDKPDAKTDTSTRATEDAKGKERGTIQEKIPDQDPERSSEQGGKL